MLPRNVNLTGHPICDIVDPFRDNLDLKRIVIMRRVVGDVYPRLPTRASDRTFNLDSEKAESFPRWTRPLYWRSREIRIPNSNGVLQPYVNRAWITVSHLREYLTKEWHLQRQGRRRRSNPLDNTPFQTGHDLQVSSITGAILTYLGS
jgi:hypothetical protein